VLFPFCYIDVTRAPLLRNVCHTKDCASRTQKRSVRFFALNHQLNPVHSTDTSRPTHPARLSHNQNDASRLVGIAHTEIDLRTERAFSQTHRSAHKVEPADHTTFLWTFVATRHVARVLRDRRISPLSQLITMLSRERTTETRESRRKRPRHVSLDADACAHAERCARVHECARIHVDVDACAHVNERERQHQHTDAEQDE
jgi:hypothetical protein